MSKMESWFKQSFIQKRILTTSNWTAETPNIVGRFKGFIQPVSASTTPSSGKETLTITHILFTSVDTSFQTGDEIWLGTRNYVVRSLQFEGVSGIEDHQELGVEYIDGNTG